MRYHDILIASSGPRDPRAELSFLATSRTALGETYVCRVTIDPLKLHRLMVKAGKNARPHAEGGAIGVDLVERKDPPPARPTPHKGPKRKPGRRRSAGA